MNLTLRLYVSRGVKGSRYSAPSSFAHKKSGCTDKCNVVYCFLFLFPFSNLQILNKGDPVAESFVSNSSSTARI
ncbi:Uncharacterised protein [Streptococcus pneumoniae]|nr:Uncharacterised protein [Streptococcus pneumoniae]